MSLADDHLHVPDATDAPAVTERSRARRGSESTLAWAEQAVRAADRRHAAIIDSLVDGVIMIDAAGTIISGNSALFEIFGAPLSWLLGQTIEDINAFIEKRGTRLIDQYGNTLPLSEHPTLVSLRTGESCTGVIQAFQTSDGTTLWMRINSRPLFDDEDESNDHGPEPGARPKPSAVVASFSDITEAREANAELQRTASSLRRERRFLQALLDNLEEGIVAVDEKGLLTQFNPASRRLHGLAPDADPIGRPPTPRNLRRLDGTPMVNDENPLIRTLHGEQIHNEEMIVVSSEQGERTVTVNGQVLVDDDGHRLGAVVAMHDVTEWKRNEERLAELAHHDPLTGVANRTLLAQRLRDALDALDGEDARREDRRVAVFLLDLDDFKVVNDELGHDVGDNVLIAVARRINAVIRPTDTVARFGGDEFVVVCSVTGGESEMALISERISNSLSKPYHLGGRTISVTASMGGVLTADPLADPSKLLSEADTAMYEVKGVRREARRPRRRRAPSATADGDSG